MTPTRAPASRQSPGGPPRSGRRRPAGDGPTVAHSGAPKGATVPKSPAGAAPGVLSKVEAEAERWAPTVARVLLGLVLAWFGYHELVAPGLWTGYVPILAATSHLAEVLVLVHGWVLLVLAVALVAGVAPRLAAAIAAVLLVEIVVSLTVSAGLSDLVLRDVGVLGLAVALTGARNQRLRLQR